MSGTTLIDRGGIYEKHVQRAGFNAGHAVILGAEGSNVIGQRFTEGTCAKVVIISETTK